MFTTGSLLSKVNQTIHVLINVVKQEVDNAAAAVKANASSSSNADAGSNARDVLSPTCAAHVLLSFYELLNLNPWALESK